MPSPISRRTLLLGSLAGPLALGGCGVRLEDDAPDIPFVPQREKIPGEAALLAVLGYLESREGQEWSTRAEELRAALTEAEVPTKLIDGATAPGSTADAVTALEGAVRDCGPGILPLVGRLTAAQIRETPELFEKPTTRAWKAGKVAAADLKATRAALYALEVIAARSRKALEKRAKQARSTLQDLSVRQTTAAGEEAGSLVLGYDLDSQVSTPQAAKKLARQSLERLVTAYANGLYDLDGDRPAALETAHWMAVAQGLAEEWGAPAEALLGTPGG